MSLKFLFYHYITEIKHSSTIDKIIICAISVINRAMSIIEDTVVDFYRFKSTWSFLNGKIFSFNSRTKNN